MLLLSMKIVHYEPKSHRIHHSSSLLTSPEIVYPLFIFNFLFIKIPHRLSSINWRCWFSYLLPLKKILVKSLIILNVSSTFCLTPFTHQPCSVQYSVFPSYCHSSDLCDDLLYKYNISIPSKFLLFFS